MKQICLALLSLLLISVPLEAQAVTAESTLNAVTEALKPQPRETETIANPFYKTEEAKPNSQDASLGNNINSNSTQPSTVPSSPTNFKTDKTVGTTSTKISAEIGKDGAKSSDSNLSPKPGSRTNNSEPLVPKSTILTGFVNFFVSGYQFVLNRAVELSLLSSSMASELRKWPSSLISLTKFRPDIDLYTKTQAAFWKAVLVLSLAGLLLPMTRWGWKLGQFIFNKQPNDSIPKDPRFGFSHSSHLGMDVVALLLFILVSYCLTFVISSEPVEFMILLTMITSASLVQLIMILARLVFSPRFFLTHRLNLSAVGIYRGLKWLRRLILVAFFGFATIVGMQLLGWPEPINAFLLKLLTFVLLVMAVSVIIIYRHLHIGLGSLFSVHFKGERALKNDGLIVKFYRSLGHFWWFLAVFYLIMLYSSWAFQFQGGAESLLKRSGLTLIIILGMQLFINSLLRLRLSTIWITKGLNSHLPLLTSRMAKYESTIRNLICIIIGSFVAMIIAEVWGLNSLKWLESALIHRIMRSGFEILLVVIVSVLIWEILGAMIEQTPDE